MQIYFLGRVAHQSVIIQWETQLTFSIVDYISHIKESKTGKISFDEKRHQNILGTWSDAHRRQNKSMRLKSQINTHPRKQDQDAKTKRQDKKLSHLQRLEKFAPVGRKLLKLRERLVSILQTPHHNHQTLMQKSFSSFLEIPASIFLTLSIQFLGTTHISMNSLEPCSQSSSHLASTSIMGISES